MLRTIYKHSSSGIHGGVCNALCPEPIGEEASEAHGAKSQSTDGNLPMSVPDFFVA